MPIFSTDEYGMTKPTILLMGNEGYGLPHEVISLCTAGIAIYPVKSLSIGFDSLNVAVAAGIILNSLTKNS
jgi:21S rRNA (GM2251-2'-O)-methyltransferase